LLPLEYWSVERLTNAEHQAFPGVDDGAVTNEEVFWQATLLTLNFFVISVPRPDAQRSNLDDGYGGTLDCRN
jgi:hypothetical protein